MRNVTTVVLNGAKKMVASIIRTGFAQRDQDHVQFQEVTMKLKRPPP